MNNRMLVLIGLGCVMVVTAIDNIVVNQQRLSAMKLAVKYDLELERIKTQKGAS